MVQILLINEEATITNVRNNENKIYNEWPRDRPQ